MPYGDRTGPQGLGPRTGRGMGFCSGFPYLGFMNPAFGKGYFCWGGRGRGWRNWYYATGLPGWMRSGMGYPAFGMVPYPFSPELSEKEEMEILKRQAEILKNQLKEIEEQINVLAKTKKEEK